MSAGRMKGRGLLGLLGARGRDAVGVDCAVSPDGDGSAGDTWLRLLFLGGKRAGVSWGAVGVDVLDDRICSGGGRADSEKSRRR